MMEYLVVVRLSLSNQLQERRPNHKRVDLLELGDCVTVELQVSLKHSF